MAIMQKLFAIMGADFKSAPRNTNRHTFSGFLPESKEKTIGRA